MANPRQNVAAPAFTPSPFGLLSVVQTPTPADAHWQNGITYQSQCVITMGALTYDECLAVTGVSGFAPPAPAAKTPTVALTTRGATPFTTYAKFDCAAVGNPDAQQIAEQALAQSGSWQVERAFWTGNLSPTVTGVFPHLAANAQVLSIDGAVLQSPAVTGGATAVDIVEGLGYLEQQLADCYNGVGVIHVAARVLPTLDAWGLVKRQGNALTTLAGNRVAVGAGYPGTSPSGGAPTATTSWIYATGAVFAYSSAVRVLNGDGAVDRTENTIRMIAERTYVLGWDCCHAGALVSLGVPIDGTN